MKVLLILGILWLWFKGKENGEPPPLFYSCPYCEEWFATEEERDAHIVAVHGILTPPTPTPPPTPPPPYVPPVEPPYVPPTPPPTPPPIPSPPTYCPGYLKVTAQNRDLIGRPGYHDWVTEYFVENIGAFTQRFRIHCPGRGSSDYITLEPGQKVMALQVPMLSHPLYNYSISGDTSPISSFAGKAYVGDHGVRVEIKNISSSYATYQLSAQNYYNPTPKDIMQKCLNPGQTYNGSLAFKSNIGAKVWFNGVLWIDAPYGPVPAGGLGRTAIVHDIFG